MGDKFRDVPIHICPHVRSNSIYLMPNDFVCELCLEDVVREAEKIVDNY